MTTAYARQPHLSQHPAVGGEPGAGMVPALLHMTDAERRAVAAQLESSVAFLRHRLRKTARRGDVREDIQRELRAALAACRRIGGRA